MSGCEGGMSGTTAAAWTHGSHSVAGQQRPPCQQRNHVTAAMKSHGVGVLHTRPSHSRHALGPRGCAVTEKSEVPVGKCVASLEQALPASTSLERREVRAMRLNRRGERECTCTAGLYLPPSRLVVGDHDCTQLEVTLRRVPRGNPHSWTATHPPQHTQTLVRVT